MPLISVALTLIVVGVVLWLTNSFIPMQGTIKNILNIVVPIAFIRWLLHGFGVLNHAGEIHLPVVQ